MYICVSTYKYIYIHLFNVYQFYVYLFNVYQFTMTIYNITSSSNLTRPWPNRGLEDEFPLKITIFRVDLLIYQRGKGRLESLSSQELGGFLKYLK